MPQVSENPVYEKLTGVVNACNHAAIAQPDLADQIPSVPA
jgi:hypothetical protein